MECDLCTERFHSEQRVPKVLPCGHTACLQCLRRLPGRPDRSCPTCRRDFPGQLEELPTNFTVLQLLLDEIRLDRERPRRGWCSDCSAAATPLCWEDHEVLNTKAALRRHLQGALQQAAGQLEGLLGQCQEEHTLQALTLLTGESWDVTLRAGDRELTGTLRNIQDPLVRAMLVVVATRAALSEKRAVPRDPQAEAEVPPRGPPPPAAGSPPPAAGSRPPAADSPPPAAESPPLSWRPRAAAGSPPPAAESPPLAWRPRGTASAWFPLLPEARLPPSAPRSLRVMNVSDITAPQEKAALLRDAPGVGRLINVQCEKDPFWSLRLLQLAAPTVEQLSTWFPREAHLLALHTMPRLRRLSVLWCPADRYSPLPEVGTLPPGHAGLQWLRLSHVPRATTRSLLRAHGHTLEELQLYVGEEAWEPWPGNCSDLHSLLQECDLSALRRLVLRRSSSMVLHNQITCRQQRAEVRRVLSDAAEVLCGSCDSVAEEDF